MNCIIVTDIYGATESVEQIAELIGVCGVTTKVVSPYEGKPPKVTSELEAYHCFTNLCGHDVYCSKVMEALESGSAECLVGFSAGAFAGLKAASQYSGVSLRHVVGFYPTRIRNDLNISPKVPTTLIFPEFEEMFDVDEVMKHFRGIRGLCSIKTPFGHGFMNPLSKKYTAEGYRVFCKILAVPKYLADPSAFRQKVRLM